MEQKQNEIYPEKKLLLETADENNWNVRTGAPNGYYSCKVVTTVETSQ